MNAIISQLVTINENIASSIPGTAFHACLLEILAQTLVSLESAK